jgi:hypothetical protein
MNLKIDPGFQTLVPPLSSDEYEQLEQNIVASNQCMDQIVVWRGIIVDGVNRYNICRKHGIPFKTFEIRFPGREQARVWIIDNQLGRRNLPDAAKIELAILKTDYLRRQARDNQRTYTKRGIDDSAPEPVNVRQEIAKIAGVGERTVQRYMQVRESNDPELLERVKNGDIKIKTASNMLKVMRTEEVFDMLSPEARREKDRQAAKKEFSENVDKIKDAYNYILRNPSNDVGAIPETDKLLMGHAKGMALLMCAMEG